MEKKLQGWWLPVVVSFHELQIHVLNKTVSHFQQLGRSTCERKQFVPKSKKNTKDICVARVCTVHKS